MANRSSSTVTNADTTTVQTLNRTNLSRGRMREDVGIIQASSDSISDVFRFVRVRSSDRISRILLSCDAVSTSGALNVGIHRTAQDGGAVVDADFFASAVVVTSALVHSDITHEADAADAGAGYGLSDTEKPLWEALGLSADPVVWYDITGSVTTALGGVGTIVLKAQYVNND
jgi:hypothetical protein